MGYAEIDANVITENEGTDEEIVGSLNPTQSDESEDDVEEERSKVGNILAAINGLQNLTDIFLLMMVNAAKI